MKTASFAVVLAATMVGTATGAKAKFMEFGHFRVLDVGAEKKAAKKGKKAGKKKARTQDVMRYVVGS